jgi:hypothetical protein
MSIDDLTIGEAKQLAGMFGGIGGDVHQPYKIGKAYLIRTVTMIQTGRVVEVGPQEIVLEEAAWIPDTGRFSSALKSLNFSEVEPFPDGRVIVGRGSVIDAVEIEKTIRELK